MMANTRYNATGRCDHTGGLLHAAPPVNFNAVAPGTGKGAAKEKPPWWSRAGPPNAVSKRGERGVQRRTRPHCRRRLGRIGQVITARIYRLALRGDQFGIDLGLVGRERLGQLLEACL